MEKDLKLEKTGNISLVDFERIMHFICKLLDRWEDKPTTHMRISDVGIGIPKSIPTVRELINDIGSFHELSYVAAYLSDIFSVNADFRLGQLSIRCKDKDTLKLVWELWQEAIENVEISRDLLKIAIPSEASRFVFSCLESDGKLSETPAEGVALERSYYLQYMKGLGMAHILVRFASFLKKNRNPDGGWNSFQSKESNVLSTANALLILSSAGETEPVKSAVEFLLSKMKHGAWTENGYPRIFVTSIVFSSLVKSAIVDEQLTQSILSKIVDRIPEQVQSIENMAIVIDVLKQAGINTSDLDIQAPLKQITAPKNISTTEQAISALIIHHAFGKSKSDPEVREIIDRLIRLRNQDGGWPFLGQNISSSYTTIAALVALNRISFLKLSK